MVGNYLSRDCESNPEKASFWAIRRPILTNFIIYLARERSTLTACMDREKIQKTTSGVKRELPLHKGMNYKCGGRGEWKSLNHLRTGVRRRETTLKKWNVFEKKKKIQQLRIRRNTDNKPSTTMSSDGHF